MADAKYAVKRQDWMDDITFAMAQKEEEARLNTLRRSRWDNREVIVHIKAQHMLRPDGTPGPEYTLRLARALDVARRLEERGFGVIFVTSGGIHKGCKTTTLADAGAEWLINHRVCSGQIVRHPTPENGNHEDYLVADMLDADLGIVGVYVVCSIGQMPRSALCFITRGWLPNFEPVTYLGLDTDKIGDDETDEWLLDSVRGHQSLICELKGKKFGVSPFFESEEAVAASEDATISRHRAEIEETKS